jgi:hypothetical protein
VPFAPVLDARDRRAQLPLRLSVDFHRDRFVLPTSTVGAPDDRLCVRLLIALDGGQAQAALLGRLNALTAAAS